MAGAACLAAFGAIGPSVAADWAGPLTPLPENEFGSPNAAHNGVGMSYQRVDITETGPAAILSDQTVIVPDANPTYPSTGTGVFEPFYTVHRSTSGGTSDNCPKNCITFIDPITGNTVTNVKAENGFNSDTGGNPPPLNYDMTRSTAEWTRSVTMSEFNITPGQAGYIELSLDANQLGSPGEDKNKIVITEMQIFIGQNLATPEDSKKGNIDPDGANYGTGYDGETYDTTTGTSPNGLWSSDGMTKNPVVWSLDSTTNGNIDILLDASICDSNGQCGSGHGDMSVFIPISALGNNWSPSDNFVLYTESLYVNDGYEEWRFRNAAMNDVVVPEPGTLAIFGIGVIGLGALRRRRRAAPANS